MLRKEKMILFSFFGKRTKVTGATRAQDVSSHFYMEE
jgi:hypothetical protein